MTTAMASLYTGFRRATIRDDRRNNSGRLGAAHRRYKGKGAGRSPRRYQTRHLCRMGNKKDLRELPDHVRQEMQFHFVDRVEEVLSIMIPGSMYGPGDRKLSTGAHTAWCKCLRLERNKQGRPSGGLSRQFNEDAAVLPGSIVLRKRPTGVALIHVDVVYPF